MESARSRLEELDRIEEALVARIRRSDQWLPSQFRIEPQEKARKLSSRECALQRWEVSRLVARHAEIKLQLEKLTNPPSDTDFDSELKQCLALSDTRAAPSLAKSYAQHRSARGKERFVCDNTEHVIAEFEKHYPPEEQWGRILRLEPYYRALLAADEVPVKPQSYRDYLLNFEQFADFADAPLVEYLVQFYNRTYALGPGTEASDLPAVREVMEATTQDPLFCRACSHKFANEAVFKAHLNGRKHKRASLKPKASEALSSPRLVTALSQYLHDAFTTTIAEIDRKAGMTVQERRLEVEAIEREHLREDTMMSGEESDVKERNDAGPTKQLLGPEGTPIPRWLFKLHGLSTTFRCEICQPHANIAGRTQFERHFRDPKHLQSLKRLGITPSDAYRGITTAADALDLRKALESETNGEEKEVEDDEGNVMSEKMMNDLKKQGLI